MRKFEVVKEKFRKYAGKTILPTRSTIYSAGYDFYSKVNVTAKPNEIVRIWSDIKVRMNNDEVLMLYPRSSMGGKWMLTMTTGVIDADYYSNKKNDGNIGLFLKNISEIEQTISIGDKIAQGVFVKYLKIDDDKTTDTREGGFGSTNNLD